jgi:hypothetical protein
MIDFSEINPWFRGTAAEERQVRTLRKMRDQFEQRNPAYMDHAYHWNWVDDVRIELPECLNRPSQPHRGPITLDIHIVAVNACHWE